MQHLKITVKGKVQGVYFRASTRLKAIELGLTGYVENRPDGSVYLEAEGEEAQLKKLVQWCNIGPDSAVVEDVSYTENQVLGFLDFQVRR